MIDAEAEEQDPAYFRWKQYRRTPILIHPTTCIVIQLFTGDDNMADLWTTDTESTEHPDAVYDRAAEQFIAQLEGNDCIAFHQALVRASQKRIDEWAERCKQIETKP